MMKLFIYGSTIRNPVLELELELPFSFREKRKFELPTSEQRAERPASIKEGEEAKTLVQVRGLTSTPASRPNTLRSGSLVASEPPAPWSSHNRGSEEHRFRTLTGSARRFDDDRLGGVYRLDGEGEGDGDGDGDGWGWFCLLLLPAGTGTRRLWALSDI